MIMGVELAVIIVMQPEGIAFVACNPDRYIRPFWVMGRIVHIQSGNLGIEIPKSQTPKAQIPISSPQI